MLALKHAFRQLIKSPGFTFTALATLAICLGANLTIFAVIDAVLVRALPFPDPERLAIVYNAYPGAGVERAGPLCPTTWTAVNRCRHSPRSRFFGTRS